MGAAALEAGKHVICDKPMALNGQEAEQMLDAARKHPDQVHRTPLTPLNSPPDTPHNTPPGAPSDAPSEAPSVALLPLSRHKMQCLLQRCALDPDINSSLTWILS